MIRLWRNGWNEFIPFLDHDIEIRRVDRLVVPGGLTNTTT
jgi:hypothetical protein